MKEIFDSLREYVDAATEAALPGYLVNPDDPKIKPEQGYAVTHFIGVSFTNMNSVYDTGTFEFWVFGYHRVPEEGSIDEAIAKVGSDLRFALLAAVSPADTGYMPMVTEHVRVVDPDEEEDEAYITRTTFSVMADVRRRPA